ncbi:hypothetical protein SY88_03335 [Clostridiales bacterium PH28_bin88]|nr:hypothetical protein SY88_03335 [Clostridiales bacterium PH28_bin88]
MKKNLVICLLLVMAVSVLGLFSTDGNMSFAHDQNMESPKENLIVSVKAKDKQLTQEQLEKRFDQIHSILTKVHTGELTQEKADQILSKMKVYSVGKHTQSDIGILSDKNTAVDLPTPYSYYDDDTGHYYTGAHFFWNNQEWEQDVPSTVGKTRGWWYPMGQDDGFGITFSRPINRVTQTFDVWSESGNRTRYTYPDANSNQYGVVFLEQDKWMIDTNEVLHYNWDSGYMGVYWEPQESGQMSIAQEMAHTWENTGVSITGVGPYSVSWQFTSTSYRWAAETATAELFTP